MIKLRKSSFVYQGNEKPVNELNNLDINLLFSFGGTSGLGILAVYWTLLPAAILILYFFWPELYQEYTKYINTGFLFLAGCLDLILYFRDPFHTIPQLFFFWRIMPYRSKLRRMALLYALSSLLYALLVWDILPFLGLLKAFLIILSLYSLCSYCYLLITDRRLSVLSRCLYVFLFINYGVIFALCCFTDFYGYYNVIIDYYFLVHGLYFLIELILVYKKLKPLLDEMNGFTDYTIE